MKINLSILSFLLLIMLLLQNAVFCATGKQPIFFGVLPLERPETMFERFYPLIDYLERETGLDFELKLYPTKGARGGYTSAVKDIVSGVTPFAYLASVTSAQARHHNPKVQVLVCAQREGSPTYIGQIAVRKDSGIKRVEDLRGKRVIGASKSSTSGNLMPAGYLLEKGIKTSEFAALEFAGSHDKAALAVLAGDYDACWINEKNFNKFRNQGAGLVSIYNHPPVPEFPICINVDAIHPAAIDKVRRALLKMHDTDLTAIQAIDDKYEKWVPITWKSYDPVKKMIDKVHGQAFYSLTSE